MYSYKWNDLLVSLQSPRRGTTVRTADVDDRSRSIICSWDIPTTSQPHIRTIRLDGLSPATSAALRGSTSVMTASRLTWKPSWQVLLRETVTSTVYTHNQRMVSKLSAQIIESKLHNFYSAICRNLVDIALTFPRVFCACYFHGKMTLQDDADPVTQWHTDPVT